MTSTEINNIKIQPEKTERIKYNVDYNHDTEFSAYARLLQSKWRDKKGYPEHKLGNFLDSEFAKVSKANFLTENIGQLVTQVIAEVKKKGGLIRESRLWNNLLSSQPLCFNLFGELSFDLELASNYFNKLFPSRVDSVTSIKFEYSPGREIQNIPGTNQRLMFLSNISKKGKRVLLALK